MSGWTLLALFLNVLVSYGSKVQSLSSPQPHRVAEEHVARDLAFFSINDNFSPFLSLYPYNFLNQDNKG